MENKDYTLRKEDTIGKMFATLPTFFCSSCPFVSGSAHGLAEHRCKRYKNEEERTKICKCSAIKTYNKYKKTRKRRDSFTNHDESQKGKKRRLDYQRKDEVNETAKQHRTNLKEKKCLTRRKATFKGILQHRVKEQRNKWKETTRRSK